MRWFRLSLLIVGAFLFIVVLGSVIIYRNVTQSPLPQHNGSLVVNGLNNPVEILRDTRGVPHIYASNSYDLFFAQGYTQAQDRWWQMEFSRHTGSGTLSELIGWNEEIVGIDVFIRTIGWRRAAARDYEVLSDDTKDILHAFADGVNAYIMDKPPRDLALEYTLLGLTGVDFEIDPWQPLDSLVWAKVMQWDLGSNRSQELIISDILASGLITEDMLTDLYPPFPFDEMPTILRDTEIEIVSDAPNTTLTTTHHTTPSKTLAGSVPADVNIAFGYGLSVGSNNWVVNGDLTESGYPLMANDMHLSVGIPAIWYEIGLHCRPVTDACPYEMRGFALPAAPAIIAGHNANIGWAFTNTAPDTQDMYILRLNPNDPTQYEWNGEMRDMTLIEETINFGDQTPPLTLTVRETHLGAILTDNALNEEGTLSGFDTENPMALRWIAIQEPSTLVDAVLALNRATNWETFREALSLWDSPSQNVLYADIEGNIGLQFPGMIPIRALTHSGQTPVPGWTDDYDWQGYIPYDSLPHTYNPERGYIASANQPIAPLAYYNSLAADLGGDVNTYFQLTPAYGYRGWAIETLLENLAPHTPATFTQIHRDNYSLSAAQLIPIVANIDFEDERLNEYRDWLATWSYHYDLDSPHAPFYATFWAILIDMIYTDQLPESYNLSGNERIQWATYQLMREADNVWWDDITTGNLIEHRDNIIHNALVNAISQAEANFGTDRSSWRWGSVHQMYLTHNPLGASDVTLIEDIFNRGPFPSAGTDGAVNNMRWQISDDGFEVTGSIVSMRAIVDFSDFSNSLSVIPTGQSGHPFSQQYADQVESWLTTTYYPMHWSRETIEANDHSTLILEPQN